MGEIAIPNLLNIKSFEPSGASVDLIKQVNEAIGEINQQRPLRAPVVEKLQSELLYDRVHSSAVTEGNRLSKRETIVVLTTGVVEAGSRKDVLEVRNLAQAIIQVEASLKSQIPFTAHFIRHLHKLVLTEIDDETAGTYRKEDVAISGAKVQPPSFLDVPDLVQRILDSPTLTDSAINPIQKAAWLHWAIARIHPFKDGNGRIARLLQDYVLLTANYVPAPLQSEDREGGYYAALEAADLGDGRPLLELVAKNTIRLADRYLSIIREEEAKRDWVARVARTATEKVKQSTHRRFLDMQRHSNLLKTEFYNLAIALDGTIPGLSIKFRDYGSLDAEKFSEIEKVGTAKRTWFFGLEFQIQRTVLRYIFWYGTSHHRRPNEEATPYKSVALLVSKEEDKYYQLLDETIEDRVGLREVIPKSQGFARRRFNPVTQQQQWDLDISSGQIARDFFEEVLKKLGLI